MRVMFLLSTAMNLVNLSDRKKKKPALHWLNRPDMRQLAAERNITA